MSADQLPSLHDVFKVLDNGFRTQQTSYILQFLGRDLSSEFDVIGPYFTCEQRLEAKFLEACVFDTMYGFAAYGFGVLGLVCDGASCNLACLKRLCGVSGQYGTDLQATGGVGEVACHFTNPFTGREVYLIICPSHQVSAPHFNLGYATFVHI